MYLSLPWYADDIAQNVTAWSVRMERTCEALDRVPNRFY